VLVLVVVGVVTFLVWPSGKGQEAGAAPSATQTVGPQASLLPTIPDLHGTYGGYMITLVENGKEIYESNQVTITLTQDEERLTAVMTQVDSPGKFVGSGTATAAGQVTLKFDILGPFTLVGTQTSPGRLIGTFTYSDGEFTKGSGSGTWDVCTCFS
jgi:hypothetical protein